MLITDGDLSAAAPVIDELLAEAGDDPPTVYVASPHYRHPTLAFLSDRYDTLKWLPQSQALVLPPVGGGLALYPANSPVPEWARPYLSPVALDGVDADGLFEVYAMNDAAVTPEQVVDATFANAITLLGYNIAPGAAGTTLPLTLYWRIEDRLSSNGPQTPGYLRPSGGRHGPPLEPGGDRRLPGRTVDAG